MGPASSFILSQAHQLLPYDVSSSRTADTFIASRLRDSSDTIQGVCGLVLLIATLVKLAVELVFASEVERHVAVRRDVLCRQLQERPHEADEGELAEPPA